MTIGNLNSDEASGLKIFKHYSREVCKIQILIETVWLSLLITRLKATNGCFFLDSAGFFMFNIKSILSQTDRQTGRPTDHLYICPRPTDYTLVRYYLNRFIEGLSLWVLARSVQKEMWMHSLELSRSLGRGKLLHLWRLWELLFPLLNEGGR